MQVQDVLELFGRYYMFISRVIDAYEGKPMFTLAGYQNNKVGILVQILDQNNSIIRPDLM